MRIVRRRDERGSAAAFVVGMTITLVVVAGLVVDGGGALNARMTLADDVEAAAVAGAQATDELLLRQTGDLRIDPAEARERVQAVLAGRGYEGVDIGFSPDYQSVTVSARDKVPTMMLNLVGFNEFDISATATSEAEILP
jgi:hypothetical protein